eukprot:scaffold26294_cov112-Isochrysis_galbana.AAC.2
MSASTCTTIASAPAMPPPRARWPALYITRSSFRPRRTAEPCGPCAFVADPRPTRDIDKGAILREAPRKLTRHAPMRHDVFEILFTCPSRAEPPARALRKFKSP